MADDSTISGYIGNSLESIPSRLDVAGFKVPTTLAATLAGVGGSMLLSNALKSKLKKLKPANKQELNKIRRHFKLKDVPVLPYRGLGNAAYIEADQFHPGMLRDALHLRDRELASAAIRDPSLVGKLRRHGAIVYDDKFKTPAILAHEAGHADIGNKPWYSPSRLNQNYGRSLASMANLAAPLAGLFTGAITRNPFLGVGAGALTGAALNAPTLINEWQATNRANKYLDAKMRDEEERKKSRKTLGSAFNTYLGNAAIPAAVMGGIGGYLSQDTARRLFSKTNK